MNAVMPKVMHGVVADQRFHLRWMRIFHYERQPSLPDADRRMSPQAHALVHGFRSTPQRHCSTVKEMTSGSEKQVLGQTFRLSRSAIWPKLSAACATCTAVSETSLSSVASNRRKLVGYGSSVRRFNSVASITRRPPWRRTGEVTLEGFGDLPDSSEPHVVSGCGPSRTVTSLIMAVLPFGSEQELSLLVRTGAIKSIKPT